MPGDADQDLSFDQLDLVQVLQGGKYLTDQAATWGEGDWNAAPGGQPGSPPPGDGLFNQLDIITALRAGKYLTGPYAVRAPVPVPEPFSLIPVALGLLGVLATPWGQSRNRTPTRRENRR